jgi:hypothetical protein
MNNIGTLVIAPIRPWSDSDIYPTAYANEIRGGFHSVTGYTDLLAIPVDRLEDGMMVNVIEESKFYKLSGSTWIEIQFSGSYDTTLGDLEMPTNVGGLAAGTTADDLSGHTFTYLFDNMLFPTVAPTLTNPSKTFTANNSALYEEGSIISVQFNSAFNKGSIYNGATFQNYRSRNPNSYNYTGAQLTTTGKTDLTDVQNITNYTVLLGNQSWTGSVSYDAGVQPLDNKGNPSGSPLAAGTTSISTVSLEGVYPLFGTTISIGVLTQQALVSMSTQQIPSSNGFTLVAESGGNKQKFEIPTNWTNFPISSVQSFDTNSNSWVFEGGSAATSLTFWTQSDITHSGRAYKQYTYNGGDRGEMKIRINL